MCWHYLKIAGQYTRQRPRRWERRAIQQACKKTISLEGRWIISHGLMPKRRFPDINHNDSYAHRPYMSSCTRHKRKKAVTTSESPTAEKTATGGYGDTATESPLQRLDRRRPITCRPTLMAKRLPSLQSRFVALYRTPRVLLFSTNLFCIVVTVMLA